MLKLISLEIKSILAGNRSKKGDERIESILNSNIGQDIDANDYFYSTPNRKVEILTDLYYRIINNFDQKRINELVYISEVLNTCGLEASVDIIKKLENCYRNSRGPVSISEGIDEVKKNAKTLADQRFIIRGVEFATSRINPNNFEEKSTMGINFQLIFGADTEKQQLKEIFSGISGNLHIQNENLNVQIYQYPADNENDFFYIEVNSRELSQGDYFFLNRFVFLNIENIIDNIIIVKTTDPNLNTKISKFNSTFTIGSTQSDNLYFPVLAGISIRIYKQNMKWYICNDNVHHPLMMAFHSLNSSNENSRKVGILKGESRKVMVAGNVFLFTVE